MTRPRWKTIWPNLKTPNWPLTGLAGTLSDRAESAPRTKKTRPRSCLTTSLQNHRYSRRKTTPWGRARPIGGRTSAPVSIQKWCIMISMGAWDPLCRLTKLNSTRPLEISKLFRILLLGTRADTINSLLLTNRLRGTRTWVGMLVASTPRDSESRSLWHNSIKKSGIATTSPSCNMNRTTNSWVDPAVGAEAPCLREPQRCHLSLNSYLASSGPYPRWATEARAAGFSTHGNI